MDDVLLATNYKFDSTSPVQKQLHQVARVIATREARKAERDIFFVEQNGYDTHADVAERLDLLFKELNQGIESFTEEIKAQGVFDQVVIHTMSPASE